jgi:hypothetical protein
MLSNTGRPPMQPQQQVPMQPQQPPMQAPMQPPMQMQGAPMQPQQKVPMQPQAGMKGPNEPAISVSDMASVMRELLMMTPPGKSPSKKAPSKKSSSTTASGTSNPAVPHTKTPQMGERSMVSRPRSLIGGQNMDQNGGQ